MVLPMPHDAGLGAEGTMEARPARDTKPGSTFVGSALRYQRKNQTQTRGDANVSIACLVVVACCREKQRARGDNHIASTMELHHIASNREAASKVRNFLITSWFSSLASPSWLCKSAWTSPSCCSSTGTTCIRTDRGSHGAAVVSTIFSVCLGARRWLRLSHLSGSLTSDSVS